jgi:hypothetical protein
VLKNTEKRLNSLAVSANSFVIFDILASRTSLKSRTKRNALKIELNGSIAIKSKIFDLTKLILFLDIRNLKR